MSGETDGASAPRPRRAPAGVFLVLAAALLFGAALGLADISADERAVTAYVGRAFERIGTADSLSLSLVTEERRLRALARSDPDSAVAALDGAQRDVAAWLADLKRQTVDDSDLARRVAVIDGMLTLAVGQRREPEVFEAVQAEIVALRQEERRRIAVRRAGSADRRQATLFRALAAMIAAFAAGGLATAALVVRRRRAEETLATTVQSLSEAEADARRTGELLKGVGAASPDMIYAADRDGRLTYANPALLRTLGATWAEVKGLRRQDLRTSLTGQETLAAADRRAIEMGEQVSVEAEYRGPDGSMRMLQATKFPLRDGDGHIVGVGGVSRDITEAHAAQQALAESEARFRAIANAMPAIVWSSTSAGDFDFFNDRWYEFTGTPRGPARLSVWVDACHPDDRARVRAASAHSQATGEPLQIEFRLRRHDGEYEWVLSRASAIRDETGAVIRWMGACANIQELYESRREKEAVIADLKAREAHLKSILDSSPDAMVVIDEAGIIQSFSAAAELLFGWTAQEAIGRSYFRLLLPKADGDQHAEEFRHYLATGERGVIGSGGVALAVRKDGTTFPMETSVGETTTAAGRFVTGFSRDLTERLAAEHRFQGMQSELAHVSRLSAMGEMASSLAHELNQPLSAAANYVQGSTRLLSRDSIDKPLIQEALGLAGDQLLRAGDIIARLRAFIAQGENERRIEDLPQLLEEAGVLAMIGARDRGVSLSYEMAASSRFVLVDKVQIQQVVLNLMRNAIESMAESPERTLTVAVHDVPDGMVKISVRDTGAGLTEDVQKKLFAPFFSTKLDGMGVGLSISRTIIEAHGGRIWAEPNPMGGALFHFTLPVIKKRELREGDVV